MSYPFVALYYGANSLFRVMGNSRITFVSSVIMMLINLVIKYIFIFQMDMGVMGAGLSTLIAMAIVFIPLTKPLVSIFGVSAESEASAIQILVIYTLGSVLFYPSVFATPSALRGAGDTRFVMVVSASSMFVFRVGLAYLLVHIFHIGVIAIWIVMVCDWVVRSIIFELRFRHGKWRRKKVI